MNSMTKPLKIAGAALLPLALVACFKVQVINHAKDPDSYVDRAQKQIARIERDHPNREGRARRLCLLVHEDDGSQIIRLTVPVWLVNFGMKAGMKAAEHDHGSNKWKDRYEFDWRAVEDFGRLGPGLLVAIDDNRNKVLVWLE